MPQQVHVTISGEDGIVDAIGIPAVRKKLLAREEPFNPPPAWFNKPPSEKKSFSVYDVQLLDPKPKKFQRFSYGQPTYAAIDDGVYRYPSYTDYTLEEAKAELNADLSKRFQMAQDKGLNLELAPTVIVALQTTREAQGDYKGLVDRLARIGGVQAFRTHGHQNASADLTTATAIHNAVEEYISQCRANEAAIGAQIDAATTVEALRAIDIETGWPS